MPAGGMQSPSIFPDPTAGGATRNPFAYQPDPTANPAAQFSPMTMGNRIGTGVQWSPQPNVRGGGFLDPSQAIAQSYAPGAVQNPATFYNPTVQPANPSYNPYNPYTGGGFGSGMGGAGYSPSMMAAMQAASPYSGGFNAQTGQFMPNQGMPSWQMQHTEGDQFGGGMGGAGGAGGPDSWMQQLAQSGMGGLQSIIQGQGNPINQLPAWQAMVDAQQRQIKEGQASLQAQFDVGDNRFSSAFGTAATDYQNQAILNQNALLGQMTATAGENAQNRLLGASGQMGQFGFGAGSQLSGQDFQSQMQQYGLAAQLAGQMGQYAYGGAGQLAGLGAQASNMLYGGAMSGAQGLYGTENAAGMGMYGAQNAMLPQFMNQQYLAQALGLNAAQQYGNYGLANLGLGAQLGGQQYSQQQQAINNQYQEWLRSQPAYNPLMQLMYQAATYYPSGVMPSYAPGMLSGMMSGLGQMAGGAAALGALSDVRLKENIQQIGELKGLPVYRYNFKGDSTPQIGFMAQEVHSKYPDAVNPGGENPYIEPWTINVGKLLETFQEMN